MKIPEDKQALYYVFNRPGRIGISRSRSFDGWLVATPDGQSSSVGSFEEAIWEKDKMIREGSYRQ